MSDARVAAVVLNYRTPGGTVRAMRSLLASQRPVEDPIVLDNGSGDGSPERLRAALPRVRLFETGANLGFAGGANVGIRAALAGGAQLVLLLNSDAVLAPDALGFLEMALAALPAAGVVGPIVVPAADPARVASAGMTFSPRTGRMRHRAVGALRAGLALPPLVPADGVSGCAMLVRREVFARVGLFAEEYFFSFEDLDFCLRARAAGFLTVCATRAVALHEGSRSIGPRSARRLYFGTRNQLLLARRLGRPRGGLAGLGRACFIVALNVAHAALRAEAPLLSGLGGVMRGAWHHSRRHYGDGP